MVYNRRSLRVPFGPAGVIATIGLVAFVSAIGWAAPTEWKVIAPGGLPGMSPAEDYLVGVMTRAVAGYRFEAAGGDRPAPNRVEWNYRSAPSPYVGGFVRHPGAGAPIPVNESRQGGYDIEAQLYENDQSVCHAIPAQVGTHPDPKELEDAIRRVTTLLLSPSGICRQALR
jgi:hypothetical protein